MIGHMSIVIGDQLYLQWKYVPKNKAENFEVTFLLIYRTETDRGFGISATTSTVKTFVVFWLCN